MLRSVKEAYIFVKIAIELISNFWLCFVIDIILFLQNTKRVETKRERLSSGNEVVK